MNMVKKFTLIFLAGLFSNLLHAMEKDPADGLQLNQCVFFYSHTYLVNPWSLSNNAAGLLFFDHGKISRVNGFFSQSDNKQKRLMDPQKTLSLGAQTQSFQKIGKWAVQGSFGYQHHQYQGILYNANLDFRYMNIYMVGDSLGGKQNKGGYFFNAGVAYPFFNDRLFVGMQMDYESSEGAKAQDVRNKNTIAIASFTPSLIYNAGNWALGLSGGLSTETNFVHMKVYLGDRHTVFYHQGMGHYVPRVNLSSTTTESVRYEGDGVHAGIQMKYTLGRSGFFQSVNYYQLKTTALVGSVYRLINGITDFSRFSYTGAYTRNNSADIHHIRLEAASAVTNGTEVRQEVIEHQVDRIRRSYVKTLRWIEDKHIISNYSGGIEYNYIRKGEKRPFKYQLKAGASGSMYDASHYPVVAYGYYNATSVIADLEYQHFLKFRHLNVDPVLGFRSRMVLDSEVVYKPFPNYINSIPREDFRYFSEDYYGFNMGLNLSTSRLPFPNISQGFLNIHSNFMHYPGVNSDNNNFSLQVSLGVVF